MRKSVIVFPVLASILGLAQIPLRLQSPPPPEEMIRWAPFESLGNPPYDTPVLLDFTAGWCRPCQRMKLGVFRDAEFAELLSHLALRPVRIDEDRMNALVFQNLMKRYGVAGLPALVVVGKDGRHFPAVVGEMSTDQIAFLISQGVRRANRGLRWTSPTDPILRTTDRPIVRSFDKWALVDRSSRKDWRWSPDLNFVAWANQEFEFVDDEFRSPVDGVAYYKGFRIRTVPTVTVELPGIGEVARFEGASEVEGAPARIAEILQGHGYSLSAPPK